jgi:hypothetical protein
VPTYFDRPLMRFGDRVDALRMFLNHRSGNHPRSTELSHISRALSYVGLGAAFEEFIREFIDELGVHINAAQVPYNNLRLGVVSLVQSAAFDSAADRRRQEKWNKRAMILKMSENSSHAELPIGTRPLDGSTIKQSHVETLWLVFDLPGSPLPTPLHGLALKDLSEGRNIVAHDNTDPVAFGRNKAHSDVLRRVTQIEDVAIHVAVAGVTYVESQGYLR